MLCELTYWSQPLTSRVEFPIQLVGRLPHQLCLLSHVLRRWISRQLSLEGSMRRWFGQYCYKKALTSCKNVPWLKLSWSEPPTGSSFSATHDWNWYWAYYQAANRALRSTGGTLAPERSLPRIAARSGTNCDVTNLSRSSRSPGPVGQSSDCYQRRR